MGVNQRSWLTPTRVCLNRMGWINMVNTCVIITEWNGSTESEEYSFQLNRRKFYLKIKLNFKSATMGKHGSVLRVCLDNTANMLENQRGLIPTSMTESDGYLYEYFWFNWIEGMFFQLNRRDVYIKKLKKYVGESAWFNTYSSDWTGWMFMWIS